MTSDQRPPPVQTCRNQTLYRVPFIFYYNSPKRMGGTSHRFPTKELLYSLNVRLDFIQCPFPLHLKETQEPCCRIMGEVRVREVPYDRRNSNHVSKGKPLQNSAIRNQIYKTVCMYVYMFVCVFVTEVKPNLWSKLDLTFRGRWACIADGS